MNHIQKITGVILATIVAIGIYRPVTIIGGMQFQTQTRKRARIIRVYFESDNETALDLCANGAIMESQHN